MMFLEEQKLDLKDIYLQRTYENNKLDEYLNDIEYDDETEEEKIQKIINTEFYIHNEDMDSDSEEFDEKWEKIKSTDIKDKGKKFAKSKGLLIMKYIDKTINFKKDVLAKETFPRKLLRLSISALLTFGPLLIPGGKIIKLVRCLAGAVIASKINKKQKEKLVNLYELKIQQINDKLDSCDDDKEKFEYEKIKREMAKEAAKIKHSVNPGQYYYDMEKNS